MLLLAAMSQPNTARSPLRLVAEMPVEETSTWHEELTALLASAAELAAEQGITTEQFMTAAWSACLDARPGLREELADKELRSRLRKLRKQGLIGTA